MVVALLDRGVIKSLGIQSSLPHLHSVDEPQTIAVDIATVCEALKTNSSLEGLGIDIPHSPADVELLEDVLKDYNSSLEGASFSPLFPRCEAVWEKVEYYTELNRTGRQKLRGAIVSTHQLIRVLSEAPAVLEWDNDSESSSSSGAEQEREDQRSKKELGLMYGLLHECVGTWCSANVA